VGTYWRLYLVGTEDFCNQDRSGQGRRHMESNILEPGLVSIA
jgi:hypothetical protein